MKLKTTFRCTCGKRLVLLEEVGTAMFGCERCQCYVIVTNSRIKQYRYSGMFNWRRFMKDLYNSYIEAHRYVCIK
ncbi:MAG: hypothetical protein ACO2PN_09970 [Pyrobaculum sp.]|jgi:hypothetical protein